MKPHRLRFTGIGAYPGDVDIDFDALNTKGLYLIVGPTGSGKTTLLDAITFALYGKTAQDRVNAIVCGHVHSSPPMVEFEFSQGSRRYVVHREPPVPGRQVTSSKQWMREYDERGVEVSVVTGVTPVNTRAGEVVGLNADEFMQVILLPQGRFQDFLMAKGSDKQRILQTIFGTLTYRRVVDRLKSRADELALAVADDRTELGRRWAVVDSNITSLSAHIPSDETPDPRDDARELVRFLSDRSAALDAVETSTRDLHARLNGELATARTEADRFDKSVRLGALRRDHAAAAKSVDKARDTLRDHHRAEPVVVAAGNRDAVIDERSNVATLVVGARTKIAQSVKSFKVLSTVTQKFADAVDTATPTTLSGELSRLQTSLDEASAAFEDIEDISARLSELKTDGKNADSHLKSLQKSLVTAKAAAKSASGRHAEARTRCKGLRAAEKALDDLTALIEGSDVEGATGTVARAVKALDGARRRFDRAEGLLRDAQGRRTRQLAGVLATELAPGSKCPVCGSTDHPAKARVTTAGAGDVEAAEAERDHANSQRIGAERDLKDAEKELTKAQTNAARLPNLAEQTKINRNYSELFDLAETLDDLEEEAAEATELVSAITGEIADTKTEIAGIRSEEQSLIRQLASLQKKVGAVGTVKQVESAGAVCEQISRLLDELGRLTDRSTTLVGQEKEATNTFDRELRSSGFTDERSARRCIVDDERLDELAGLVDSFDERETEIGKLEAAVGSSPVPKKRPDLGDLTNRLTDAETRAKTAAAGAGAVRSALKQISDAVRDIISMSPRIEEKARQAEAAQSIAFVFDRGSGGQLGLEVWVQRTFFEEVCLVANEQLRSLSGNRYSLTLEQEEGGVRRQRGSGLDIYVLDSHIGTTRPVQTMSGGEQFIAALSLALALAEVVQRHAGGIELPCLFIDEGFGGLDLESLDLAIDVLMRIQATGRTVGIITHVEEMQRQLPIGIRVYKSEKGSTLEVLAE